jgi:phage gpG-like protein
MSATFTTSTPLRGGFKVEFTPVGIPELLGAIGAKADEVIDALQEEMELLHIQFANRVASGPLSGQVLNERSGNLKNSVLASPQTTRSGDVIESTVGSNMVYARIHEFGGEIRPVNAPALVFQIDGHWVRTQLVRMPRRPWLVPTFEDMQPEMEAGLSHTVEAILNA